MLSGKTILYVIIVILAGALLFMLIRPFRLKPPSGVKAIARGTRIIEINWINEAAKVFGFRVERSEGDNQNFTQIYEMINRSKTRFIDSTLARATKYFYRVRAYNDRELSAYSESESVTTLVPIPSYFGYVMQPPNKMEFYWSFDPAGADSFVVEKQIGDKEFTPIGITKEKLFYYSQSSEDIYPKYRVRAFMNGLSSAYSETVESPTIIDSTKDYGRHLNIAPQANVTCSSHYPDVTMRDQYICTNAVDGIKEERDKGEWASESEVNGAWLELEWPSNYEVIRIIVYDRPNTVDWIHQARIIFSDGSILNTGPLTDYGFRNVFDFDPKTVNWLKLEIIDAAGRNSGIAEIEVYGRLVR